MFVDLNYIGLSDGMYAYVGRVESVEILNMFQEELRRNLNMLEKLINVDYENISDDEFYNLISEAYSITFNDVDYLNVISKMNNKKFKCFMEIGTYMTFNDIARSGHGKSFDFWEQLYQVKYVVAVAEDAKIENDSILTKKEIKDLIGDNKIVIVQKESVPIYNELQFDEAVEVMPSIDLDFNYYDGRVTGDICKNDYFSYFVALLRKKFTKKKIISDMKNCINELENQISEFLSFGHNDSLYSDVLNLCNNWYNTSEERQKVKNLIRQLNTRV